MNINPLLPGGNKTSYILYASESKLKWKNKKLIEIELHKTLLNMFTTELCRINFKKAK